MTSDNIDIDSYNDNNDNNIDKLLKFIDDNCNLETDIKNDYNYNLWKEKKNRNIDDSKFKYILRTIDNRYINYSLENFNPNKIKDSKLYYKLYNNNIIEQIPFIKLFIITYFVRNRIVYHKKYNNYTFTFNLYNDITRLYDKQVYITVNNKILTHKNQILFINSNKLIHYLIFKAILKLSNILDINIKNINVNSLICSSISSNNKLLKLSFFDKNKDKINNSYYNIDDMHLSSKNRILINKYKWSIKYIKVKPYNKYADMIYFLFKNNYILGITIGNTLFYIIENMTISENGELILHYYNIIRGNTINLPLSNIIKTIGYIGIIL